MTDVRRKLGWKNYGLFGVLVALVVVIGVLFAGSIILFNRSVETYEVGAKSMVLGKDYKIIDVPMGGRITRKASGELVLTAVLKDGEEEKYDLGKRTVVYSDNDYKVYLYGQAYLIGNDKSVKKIDGREEVSKSEAAFYKLDDRKYLIIDKLIRSREISLDEDGYLLVDIDRQGNATLVNMRTNLKTINPIVIKGTYFDFDVAHEKLLVDDTEIDLANVIGTTNEYKDPVVEEGDGVGGNKEQAEDVDYTKDIITYYDKQFNRVKNSFNNLFSSAEKMNKSVGTIAQKTSVSIDLTRWTNVSKISSTPSTITLDYVVFDPNNDYSQIFVLLSEYGSSNETRVVLNKENTSFVFRDLQPDKKYSLRYGYTLAKIVDESQADVIVDTLVVVTSRPKTEINIRKISTNRVQYVLKLDREYAISQAKVRLLVDNVEQASVNYNIADAVDYTYTGSFNLGTVGRVIEVRVTDMKYNDLNLGGWISDIYINE